MQPSPPATEEHFDIVDASGVPTGETRPRSEVHAKGLRHRACHVWLLAPQTGELLLQRRADVKDSWPGRWDISSAGHLSAGEESLPTAMRELDEELGLAFPATRFEFLFTHFEELESVQRGRRFINNEFNAVFLVTLTPAERAALRDDAPPAARAACPLRFALQASEVSAVSFFPWQTVRGMYERACAPGADAAAGGDVIVPLSGWDSYSRLFDVVERRCAVAASAPPADAAQNAGSAAVAAAGGGHRS